MSKEFVFVGVQTVEVYTIVEGETREEAFRKLQSEGPFDTHGHYEQETVWIKTSGQEYEEWSNRE